MDKTHGAVIDSSNDSRSTGNGIRNGFRPSTIRHHKLRLTTAVSQRNNENKDSLPKVTFIPSQASAKLKSEIDHINNKLIKTKESSKSLRLQNIRVRRKISIMINKT
jgi:CRISPR/Cas system CMR-associated protein Cmr5 small subunit